MLSTASGAPSLIAARNALSFGCASFGAAAMYESTSFAICCIIFFSRSVLGIFRDLPLCELRVPYVEDHRISVTMAQPAFGLEPLQELGMLDETLLVCQSPKVLGTLASLCLNVVQVRFVRHGQQMMQVL